MLVCLKSIKTSENYVLVLHILWFLRYSKILCNCRKIVDPIEDKLCLKKVYHPTTNYNFNSTCPIPVIFGTVITE